MLFIPQYWRVTIIQTDNSSYSHTDEINGIKSANSEVNILDSNFVVSVESIQLQIASGEINVSAPFSKDQAISICVPFVSMKCDYIGANDWDMLLGDVYFDENLRRIMITRSQGVEISLEFYIYVVEFDNFKVNVQSGSFNISGDIAIKTIFPVNRSKAFALSYWYAASGDFSWEHAMVATNISGDDILTFKRGSELGSIYGHYYVIEAKDNEFCVETTNITIDNSQTINTGTISSVIMSKSIVVSSYYTTYIGSDARYGACDVWLSNNDTVSAQRDGQNSNIYINTYVISFSGYQTVQRGLITFASSQSAITSEFPNAIDNSRSIVHSPNPYGIMRAHHSFSSTSFATACSRYRFISNDTIEGMRGAPNSQVTSISCIRVITSKIPLDFELTTNAEDPDTDGIFTLNWTDSLYVDNYSIYISEDYITEIDESVTLFKRDITGLAYSFFNMSDGLHYFVVVAYTEYANRSSNVINVVIYTSRAQLGFLPLLIIVSIVSVISAGLLGLLYFINKKYYSLTKFQREIRNLKTRLLNGKYKKNSGLTRETMVKQDINKIISSIKSISKRIKENE